MSEYPSGKTKMPSANTASEIRDWVKEAADARGGRRKTALAEIARETSLCFRRVAAIFYGEVHNPRADEYLQLRNWRQYELTRRLERKDAEVAELRRRLAEWSNE